jgi:hypothetical protein
VGRGQVGAEVGALTQPAETMGRGLTQRVGTYQQRGKKKNLQARTRTEGMRRKKERKGRVTLGKECQQRKKKRIQTKKKLTAGGGADVGSGAQTKRRMKNRLGV